MHDCGCDQSCDLNPMDLTPTYLKGLWGAFQQLTPGRVREVELREVGWFPWLLESGVGVGVG